MKHAILGAGAVGGLMGTALAMMGESVVLVVRPERLAVYPSSLMLERPRDVMVAPAEAVAALSDRVDVLWVATKAFQLLASLEAVRARPSRVVPLLNGLDHIMTLRARLGDDRVVPATITVEAEKIAPGRFRQCSSSVTLNLAASGEPCLASVLTRLTELGFITQFPRSEQSMLWNRLCFLAPFELVTAAAGLSKGAVAESTEWGATFRAAMTEACAVANASGASVNPAEPHELFDSMPPSMRSSMEKDLAAGRELELDAIAGPIVRGADRYGIDAATTTALAAVIRAKARRPPAAVAPRPARPVPVADP